LTDRSILAKIERMFVAPRSSELPTTFQASLFGGGAPVADPRFRSASRAWLDDESWVDVVPAWLAGADSLFDHLASALPWKQRTVPMYEQMVDEPRLVYWWSDNMDAEERQAASVHVPMLHELRLLVSVRYGKVFDSFGCNFYRTGRDSVAWHRDRTACTEAIIAIVTVGGTRPFHIRPRGGGHSVTFLPASGDLVVLGGRTNDNWEHCVPKVQRADPRISISFRHDSASAARPSRSRGVHRELTPNRHHEATIRT
jgi:alkylated DNA repair dioxygenase AlkB